MKPWFEVKNEAPGTTEVCIYEQIGRDWWSEDGIAFKDFAAAWKAIPAGNKISLRINSIGGSVWDGLPMYHLIRERAADVTCINDGVAYSTAGWLMCAGSKAVAPKTAMFMYHNPFTMVDGDAATLRKTADDLEKVKQNICTILCDKCKKSSEEVSKMMDATTYMTGAEAKEYGFVDELTDTPADIKNSARQYNFKACMRVHADAATKNNGTPEPKPQAHNHMRKQLLDILNKWGIKVSDDATDEQLLAEVAKINPATAPPQVGNAATPDIQALAKQIADIQAANALATKTAVHNRIAALNAEARITADQMEFWEAEAIRNPAVLDRLAALPQNLPGPPPAGAAVISDDIRNVSRNIVAMIPVCMDDKMTIVRRFDPANLQAVTDSAKSIARMYADNRAKLMAAYNTNTIPSGLKLTITLQEAMRAFKKKVLPLRAFSTVFSDIPIKLRNGGAETIDIPYYPLQTAASTAFSSSYSTGNTTVQTKQIAIDKRYYQGFSFTSAEWSRQPFFSVERNIQINAEKLAVDTTAEVLSLITLANYGAAVFTGLEGTFDALDLADIQEACDAAHWPESGRSCILRENYYSELVKDTAIANAAASGSGEALREGVSGRLYGFDMIKFPSLPSNSQNLVGAAIYPTCMGVATAPIEPAPGVMAALYSYQVVTDPDTGISFSYRWWGAPSTDTDSEIIEVAYGRAAIETAACKRIVSA